MSDVIAIGTAGQLKIACLSVINQSIIRRATEVQPRGLSSSFCINGAEDVNAWVERGTVPKYWITYGAMMAVLDLSMEIASTLSFCPDVLGECLNIIKGGNGIESRFCLYPCVAENENATSQVANLPEGRERQNLGWFIYTFALRFLSLHEQGHFLQGHLHVDRRMKHAEIDGAHNVSEEWMRALEIQADSFAFRNSVLFGVALWDEDPLKPSTLEIVQNQADWTMYSLLGAIVVFVVLSIRERARIANQPVDSPSKHPSIGCRIYGIMNELSQIRSRVRATAGQWDSATDMAFQGMNAALGALPESEGDTLAKSIQSFIDQSDVHFREELKKLAAMLDATTDRLSAAIALVELEVGEGMLRLGAQR